MSDKIQFLATLPPIQSAYNIGGEEGDGARIKIDVPGSDLPQILKLLTMRGKVFRVTVEVDE